MIFSVSIYLLYYFLKEPLRLNCLKPYYVLWKPHRLPEIFKKYNLYLFIVNRYIIYLYFPLPYILPLEKYISAAALSGQSTAGGYSLPGLLYSDSCPRALTDSPRAHIRCFAVEPSNGTCNGDQSLRGFNLVSLFVSLLWWFFVSSSPKRVTPSVKVEGQLDERSLSQRSSLGSTNSPGGSQQLLLPKKRISTPKIELTPAQVDDIKEAFELFDRKGEGRMEIRDIKVALRALGFEPKKDEIKKLLSEVTTEHDGYISFAEFIQIMTLKLAEKDSKEEILKAFRLFDDDETGKISFKNLKRVATELGENLHDEELQEMIDEADLDGDGEISEEEFLRIMQKTNLY